MVILSKLCFHINLIHYTF